MNAPQQKHRPVAATVHRLFDEHDNGHDIKRWNAVRRWGAKNAYTLIFLSAMFILTWVLMLLGELGVIRH